MAPRLQYLRAGLFLALGVSCFIAALVMMDRYGEGFQAGVWLLFATLLCLSLTYTSIHPRRERNLVVLFMGIWFAVCTIVSMAGYAAGLNTPTLDSTAMSLAIPATLFTLIVVVFWTMAGRASAAAQKGGTDLSADVEAGKENSSSPSGLATKSHRRLDSKPCTICCNILWILVGVVVALFTADAIGTVTDARTYMPLDSEFASIPVFDVANASLRESFTGARDNPIISVAHKRHFVCNGTGSPLVILEHGRGGTIYDWAWVQRLVSGSPNGTTVCAFSRSGYGFSSRGGNHPRTAAQAALELKQSLISRGLDVPFIHVGHSWGGLAMRMYQKMYPSQVLAMVFVDAVNVDCLSLCSETKPSPSGLFQVFAAIAAAGVPRALAATGALPLNGTGLLKVMPEEVRGPRLATINSVQFWQTYTAENEEISRSCGQVKRVANTNITTLKVPVRNIVAEEGIFQNNLTCGGTLAGLSNPPGTTVVVPSAPHIELLFDLRFAQSVADEVVDVVRLVRLAG